MSPRSSCRRLQRVPGGDVDNPISIALYVSDVRRTGPNLVPREIEMVYNLATVVGVSTPVGHHHPMKIGSLLISHLINRFRLGPAVIGDKNDEMTILPIHGQPLWLLAKGVLDLSSIENFSRGAD